MATSSLYDARMNEVKQSAGAEPELARQYGARANMRRAGRPWRQYRLSDEFYRYAARRDLGLPPTRDRIPPRRCGACRMGIAADGYHGQRCIHNSAFTKLRHDSIEALLHDVIRDGVGLA